MITLYLAHNFLTRKMVRKWELKVEGKYNINLDNPFYDNSDRAEEMLILDSYKDTSRKQRDYLSTRSSKNIVEDDLEKIRKSDGIVAVMNDTRIGTPMEVFFAARVLRIPVYIITKKHAYHPWIVEHATYIFKNREVFEQFVKKKFGIKK
jgi:nucleoside 2-deoxyribosyltransferase